MHTDFNVATDLCGPRDREDQRLVDQPNVNELWKYVVAHLSVYSPRTEMLRGPPKELGCSRTG